MSDDFVRLTVTGMVTDKQYMLSMPYPRACWDVPERDREQLRLIARHRFGNWVHEQFGIRLDETHLDALPVSAS